MNTEKKGERTQPASVIEDLHYSQITDQSVHNRRAVLAANRNANPNAMLMTGRPSKAASQLMVKPEISLETCCFIPSSCLHKGKKT